MFLRIIVFVFPLVLVLGPWSLGPVRRIVTWQDRTNPRRRAGDGVDHMQEMETPVGSVGSVGSVGVSRVNIDTIPYELYLSLVHPVPFQPIRHGIPNLKI